MTTIVITGGNRGIGLHLARRYAEAGCEVVQGVRNPDSAGNLPGETLPLDVGDDASVAAFAAALGGRPIDILINNAGSAGPDRQSAIDTDFAGFLDVLNINTLGPLRVTQALLPGLRKAKGAKVAIISSRMGSFSDAQANLLAYRASKAAANKIAQGLATDLAPDAIAVAALHPGWVRTDMGGSAADISPEESAQ
ncbi:MAG: short-chain dehydrogenase, partial [Sphingobium sp. 32-64-5]